MEKAKIVENKGVQHVQLEQRVWRMDQSRTLRLPEW